MCIYVFERERAYVHAERRAEPPMPRKRREKVMKGGREREIGSSFPIQKSQK